MINLRPLENLFADLYGNHPDDIHMRYQMVQKQFSRFFGGPFCIFSAPGRSEIGGNHTDHNRGRVLAASVSVDMIAFAHKRGDMLVRLRSHGFDGEFSVDLNDLSVKPGEFGSTQALIRGVAAGLKNEGYAITGFDAYVHSMVPQGSGLSSSAAFEVLVATILSGLCGYELDPVKRAVISKYAENVYFNKPSGLMDQTACSVGGLITIDFRDEAEPDVQKIDFDFSKTGYSLVVTNTGGSHSNLTGAYAQIPAEMKQVAKFFGKDFLREVDEDEFFLSMGRLFGRVPDRAILRAMHFFHENRRVGQQVEALRKGDFKRFLDLVTESGESSCQWLQNVFIPGPDQRMSVCLALSEKLLSGAGAWRVHGGGFAGTCQAFVPHGMLDDYIKTMNNIFGDGAAYALNIRQAGAMRINPDKGDYNVFD